MKAVLIALLAVTSALAFTEQEYQDSFVSWMKKFEKTYEAAEFFHRYGIFKATMDRVEAHNALNLSWTSGLNQFSDLTNEEFGRIYASGYKSLGVDGPEDTWVSPVTGPNTYPNGQVDWVAAGAVTPVKNQGQCGSCWAFSTTGSVEGWIKAVKGAALISLSEEELVECSTSYGNDGCNGGMYTYAGKYIHASGDTTESAYPYSSSAGVTGTCACGKTNACTPSTDTLQLTAITMFTGENAIGTHCDTQPVSVAIQANQAVFQDYSSGTFCSSLCGTNLDHAVLVVGYANDSKGTPYWKVKNSWGTTWGMAGYIDMCRNQNICGIGKEPGYAN
jgi:cathepsin L